MATQGGDRNRSGGAAFLVLSLRVGVVGVG